MIGAFERLKFGGILVVFTRQLDVYMSFLGFYKGSTLYFTRLDQDMKHYMQILWTLAMGLSWLFSQVSSSKRTTTMERTRRGLRGFPGDIASM